MKYKILFSEQQKFRQTWLWILLIIVALSVPGIFVKGFIQQVIQGVPFGNDPMSNGDFLILLILISLLMFLMILMFLVLRLDTTITEKEIGVRFYPFQRKFRYYQWENISRASVQKYNPFKYGGWGLKGIPGGGFRVGASGIKLRVPIGGVSVYSVSGNKALHLQLENGKKMLIGTGKPLELEAILRKIKPINKEY